MDELSDNFGNLSTSAKEWTPGSAYQSTSSSAASGWGGGTAEDSDLNASSVREFVPGMGWNNNSRSAATSSKGGPINASYRTSSSGTSSDSLTYSEQDPVSQGYSGPIDSTVAAGPSAAPPIIRSLHGMGLTDDLWHYFRDINMEQLRQMEPTDPRHKAVPPPFTNAFCLDDLTAGTSTGDRSSSFGYPCSTFRVTNRETGYLSCLRRFDNVKSVSPRIAATVLAQWSQMGEHPGICRLEQCYVSQRAVFFVHSYVSGSVSLKHKFSGALPEALLWSVIVQCVNALRRVHRSNLAMRTMDMKHVLVKADASSSRVRVFFNCAGIIDALEFESRKNIVDLQQDDIRALGRLILSLATGTEITPKTDSHMIARCEQFFLKNHSAELHNLCFALLRSQIPPTIQDISRALVDRSLDELDQAHLFHDRTEAALAAEYESGRAMRLLLKLGFCNDRPEFGVNRRWAYSGDAYMLNLFRDYVFHQADGAGQPVLDIGHVISCLNKLDAADEERIVLASRDGKSVMVVSFAEVARCLESAFHELCSGSVPPVQY